MTENTRSRLEIAGQQAAEAEVLLQQLNENKAWLEQRITTRRPQLEEEATRAGAYGLANLAGQFAGLLGEEHILNVVLGKRIKAATDELRTRRQRVQDAQAAAAKESEPAVAACK